MSLLETLFRQLAMTPARLQPRPRRSIPWAAQQLELRTLLSASPSEFVDPHPQVGNQFGATVTPVANGNVVITAPNDDSGGGSTVGDSGAGAVYLYNGQTGALISTLSGSHPGDHLGSGGVSALTNGNFVIDSPKWNGGLGAVTWGNGTSGVAGSVSAANSLVGTLPNDHVGDTSNGGGITALSNGNYVVDSPAWNNNFGAVTWGNGTSGGTGTVSAANSLVGIAKNDFTGSSGVTALSNGNYVVDSPAWNNNFGAVTWGSGTSGVKGAVDATNSLIGSSKSDSVGSSGITALSRGNYVIDSPAWNNKIGAVTWSSGTAGITGLISATNSLVGNVSGDAAGSQGILTL